MENVRGLRRLRRADERVGRVRRAGGLGSALDPHPRRRDDPRIADGAAGTTDGAFAEAKELLAGFSLVDCETEARAIEIAGRIPEAPFGVVQVRAIMDLSAVEM